MALEFLTGEHAGSSYTISVVAKMVGLLTGELSL
jgi:hypothetical protein